MKCKIAVASTDGKVVNQHFGRAEEFFILEADTSEPEEFELSEIRRVKRLCEGGEHSDAKLEQAIRQVMDCQYILVSRIGRRAENAVEAAGIQVFELPGIIRESVEELLKYVEIQNMISEMAEGRKRVRQDGI